VFNPSKTSVNRKAKTMPIKQQGSIRHKIEIFYAFKSKTNKFIWLILLVLILATYSKAEEPKLLRIGTGGQTGVYYPIGKIIAQGLTSDTSIAESGKPGENGVPGYIGVAQNSAGSIDNVLNVVSGAIEAGLVQADVAAWAFGGEQTFKGNNRARSIRAVASLYPEKFQIVTRKDANIRNVHDLRGKRISIDEIGSGTLAVMRIVLEAYGMTENDLLPVYLKPVFTHEKIINGELQGFVMMAGAPMAAVSQLSSVGISLVPILPEFAARIEAKYPYLVPGRIPANVYPGIPEISTIQVYALLVVNETMDDALVYQITAALWSHRMNSMLKTGHAQGKSITPATALVGISIPLHPGAEKYYQENSKRFNGS
jgi:TRAP transporter TAXI family solute receptor